MLIGASAALLLTLNGRIAGISGILGGVLSLGQGDLDGRIAFLAGLVLSPLAYAAVGGVLPPVVVVDASLAKLVFAGLLVGFGARLAGLHQRPYGLRHRARLHALDRRTGVFMSVAVATVLVTRHLLGR